MKLELCFKKRKNPQCQTMFTKIKFKVTEMVNYFSTSKEIQQINDPIKVLSKISK